MDYSNYTISEEQAQSIAFNIVNDISAYIREHEEEYKKWLEKQDCSKVVENL